MSGAPFVCQRCGDEFEKDPRLTVACSVCGAEVGRHCRRPSEHRGGRSGFIEIHKPRRLAAFEAAPCSCLALWEAEHGAEPQQSPAAPQLPLL